MHAIRLVKAIHERYPGLSLQNIRRLIKEKKVTLNGRLARIHDLATEADDIQIEGSEVQGQLKANEKLDCRKIFETTEYLFFSKGPFIHSVAHRLTEENSAANWLLSQDESLRQVSSPLESGLAHRLDLETSGVMVAARTPESLEYLRGLFKTRDVEKEYVCLVRGDIPEPGVYHAYAMNKHGSKKKVIVSGESHEAAQEIITEILKTENLGLETRVTVRLITGHRHQIRAHLLYLGCPIVGDMTYRGFPGDRLMLHACRLGFRDPNGQWLEAADPSPF